MPPWVCSVAGGGDDPPVAEGIAFVAFVLMLPIGIGRFILFATTFWALHLHRHIECRFVADAVGDEVGVSRHVVAFY